MLPLLLPPTWPLPLPELLLLLPLFGRMIIDDDVDDDERLWWWCVVSAIGPPTSIGDSDLGGGVSAPFSDDCIFLSQQIT